MTTAAIILAAGQGTRMKSSLPKVLHKVAGPGSIFSPRLVQDISAWRPGGKMRPENKEQARHG
jgi:bifunctional UDP-N-acetylglucosamine pyrophosphorylase/glucosamine-1-phosphate N-acetyltransferase